MDSDRKKTAFNSTIKKFFHNIESWPKLFLDQDGKLYYGRHLHLFTIMVNHAKMVIQISVDNKQPELLQFFLKKLEFLCPYEKEIIETKKYVDKKYRFRLPCKKYSDEFIAKGISNGTLCIVEGVLYRICITNILVEHTIHKINYKINFKSYDNEINFRTTSIILIFDKICSFVSRDMWNGMDKYYIHRVPYLMLKDGTQYNEKYSEQYPHIKRYLFNSIMCREICSYIGCD
jgi:hypothetical protein